MERTFAKVAVPTPARTLFTYRIPAALRPLCRPGMRVVVPFGPAVLTGFITELTAGSDLPESRVKKIQELLDPVPVVSPELLEFTRWVADYYLASWGEVIKAALPAGIHVRSVPGYRLTEAGERALGGAGNAALKEEERALLERIGGAGSLPRNRLAQGRAGGKTLRLAESLVRRFLLARVPVRVDPRVKDRRVRLLELDPDAGAAKVLESTGRPRRGERILEELRKAGGSLLGSELAARVPSPYRALRSLIAAGVVRESWVERGFCPRGGGEIGAPPERLRLNPGQRRAVRAVIGELERNRFRVLLLKGITGSGKTEVYLRGIEKAASLGKRALYLVPEISLTPLLERSIRSRFPGSVEVLHSRLGGRERLAAWRRIREGGARVVLGTRSAVFAPQPDLGLVIVDEEQEESYKQEESPRYNGRDAAVMRGKMAGALVLLGTATPAMETHHHATTGRYRLLELPGRVEERALPAVTMVDMREEFRRRGERVILSARLEEALRERCSRGEQSLVLLNRRGWAAFLLCRACGKVLQCARCSISFTYHKKEGVLKCHYCGRRGPVPSRCPSCGSEHLHFGAEGTEQVEEVIREVVPGARMARMDRDTVLRREGSAEILSRFQAEELDVLLGTQMIAKGHHFPRVTLVGVLSADHLLAFPDFRASERTFQLLTQVSGRSGRGEIPGEVIIQAFHTEHYAIQAARDQDPPAFYEKELRYRRIMKYPPFTVLAALIVRNRNLRKGQEDASRVSRLLEDLGEGRLTILGPALAPIGRLRGEYRHQILIKGERRGRIRFVLKELLSRLRDLGILPRNLIIDVDPITTM